MSIPSCYSEAGRIFTDWIIPERLVHLRLGEFYQKNPIMSRVMAAPIALFSGIVKVFLFPLICLVGVVAMPIIALVRVCGGKVDGGDWLKAWCFCILGVAGSIAFLGVLTYYLTLVTTSALLVTIIAISVVIHIETLVKEPIEPPPFQIVDHRSVV